MKTNTWHNPKVQSWKEIEPMGSRLQKSIYGLETSLQIVSFKVDETIREFGFKGNEKDNSVYAKFQNEKLFFHILYIDDILLTSSNVNLPLEKKSFSSSFNVNDLGEVSLVLGIEIHRDRRKGYQAYSIGIPRKDSKVKVCI